MEQDYKFCITVNYTTAFKEHSIFVKPEDVVNHLPEMIEKSKDDAVTFVSVCLFARHRFTIKNGEIVRSVPHLGHFYDDPDEDEQYAWSGNGTFDDWYSNYFREVLENERAQRSS